MAAEARAEAPNQLLRLNVSGSGHVDITATAPHSLIFAGDLRIFGLSLAYIKAAPFMVKDGQHTDLL